jgi:hypothetical protein
LSEVIDRLPDAGKHAEARYRAKLAVLVSDPEYLALLNKHLDDSTFVIMKVSDHAVADIIASIYQERSLDRRARRLRESRAWARSHPVRIVLGRSELDLGKNRAMVIRPAGSIGRVLVILRQDATAMDIALAYRMVFELRDLEGDFVERDERVLVRAGAVPAPANRLLEYERLIERLKAARGLDVEGIRFASAIETRLGHLRAAPGGLSRRTFNAR